MTLNDRHAAVRKSFMTLAFSMALASCLVLVPRPVLAGSRGLLGVAAGVVVGAAVLGAIAGSQRAHAARPNAARPKAPSASRKSQKGTATASDSKGFESRGADAKGKVADGDPFAPSAAEAQPVASKP